MCVQVHYVDHGFSEVISRSKVFELQEKFFQLPFQASKCKLAGDDRLPLSLHQVLFSPLKNLWGFFCASKAWSRSARNPKC